MTRFIRNDAFRGVMFLLLLLFFTFLIPRLPLQDPLRISLDHGLSPPSLDGHLLGADALGRDILSRTLHGFALTVRISIFALLSSFVFGVILGGTAGYFYKTSVDKIFNWIVGVIFSLPFLLIMASIMALFKPGVHIAYGALIMVMWVGPARIVRAEVVKTRGMDHVRTLRAFGASEIFTFFNAVLPACIQSALIFSLSYLPEVIGLEAGLSFLGLGVQPPEPGLGKMIFDGLGYLYSAWWLSLFPALALFLTVLCINGFAFGMGSGSAKQFREG